MPESLRKSWAMSLLVPAILLCTARVGSAQIAAHPVSCGDTASAQAQIRGSLADWVEATHSGDRWRAAQIWAKDLLGWNPGQPDDTYQREMEQAQRNQGKVPPLTIGLTVHEVLVCGDLAVVRDTWRYTRATPNPALPDSIWGYEVWRKQPDGTWKISRWLTAPHLKQP